MRKVYWLSVAFLILVESGEDRRRRGYDKMIAQICEWFLGTRCPQCGQWLPTACSVVAHGLVTDCPQPGHRLPTACSWREMSFANVRLESFFVGIAYIGVVDSLLKST